jgi:hypothetical protein
MAPGTPPRSPRSRSPPKTPNRPRRRPSTPPSIHRTINNSLRPTIGFNPNGFMPNNLAHTLGSLSSPITSPHSPSRIHSIVLKDGKKPKPKKRTTHK